MKPATQASPEIIRLDSNVVDQIAAGEVVDRPGHMIKELVENAVDAGADEISVRFDHGGRNVLVQDNGRGIRPNQLALAVARHATSKIKKADDLWQIASYGFRGEALASIAAVSQLTITSRSQQEATATQITVKFGQVEASVTVGGDVGTTVEVRDLFQNTPARLKFLKSESAEAAQVKNQLKALALANINVAFRIYYENELVYFWPTQATKLARTQDVLNESELYVGESKIDGMSATAVVASPNRTFGNSRQIWILVQGRNVQDRGLQAAVLEGYRNFLMHGEFPVAAIFLQCDPEDLDVNVSPTKSQVKFRDSSSAFRVVQRAVRQVMESSPWVAPMLKTSGLNNATDGASPVGNADFHFENLGASASMPESVFQAAGSQYSPQSENAQLPIMPSASASPAWSQLEILGQSNLTYIVTQTASAVLFIDQHAAHERIMFEKLMASIRTGKIEVQNFLMAPVVEVGEDAAAALMAAKDELAKWGLHIDLLSPTQIAVNAAPALARPEALPILIEKLASDLTQHGGSHSLENRIADRVATLACHSAIRAGQSLSLVEMQALLEQMDEFPQSSFCPHGRPVFVEYSFHQLERDFGRIV